MSDWRNALAKPILTLEEFQHLCTQALLELFPDASAKPGSASGELVVSRNDKEPLTIFLGNIWNSCKHEPNSRLAEVQRFLRIVSAPKTSTGKATEVRFIVPMIKDHGYLAVGARATGRPQFVHEHFVGDLWIVYAIDEPDRMSSLLESQFEQLGIARENLKAMAVQNLRRILPPVERHGEGPLYMLTAGSDYAASLLLFDELWAESRELIDGDLIASAPSRDVVLFTGSNSADGIRAMRESINRVAANGSYLVNDYAAAAP